MNEGKEKMMGDGLWINMEGCIVVVLLRRIEFGGRHNDSRDNCRFGGKFLPSHADDIYSPVDKIFGGTDNIRTNRTRHQTTDDTPAADNGGHDGPSH